MRVRTGVEGFDPIVGGGLPEGASVVLQGPAGNEKDLFGLQFLAEGLRSGEAIVIVVSSQSPEQYLESLAKLDVNVKEAIAGNRVRVVDWHAYQEGNVAGVEERDHIIRASVDLTNVGIALSRALGTLATGVPRRAVLEVLSPALQVFEVGQVYAFAQSGKAKLARHKFTALFLLEKEMHSPATVSSVSQPFDGVIDIDRRREGDTIVRKIGVLSMKDTVPDERFHEFLTLAGRGLIIKPEGPSRPPSPPRVPEPPPAVEASTPAAPPSNRAAMILRIAEERVRIDPHDADALFAKASALAAMGDMRGAIGALDALVTVQDTYPGLWVLRTKLFARIGDPESARDSRRRADEVARREEHKARTGDTVPCPLCEGPVPVDAHECPNCGARFIEEVGLAEELDSLGKAAIQDRVGEDLQVEPETGKPMERRPPKPADRVLEPRVPSSTDPTDRRGMTNGLVRESIRGGAGRTNGLTNGLKGRTNGLTNGLKGRTNGLTNGLKGRTNGLTNGLKGRTNGLTNGLKGRTNGLTNGLKGRTNGLTNNQGRTNGMTNGLQAGGRTNGVTNGLAALRRGMTNGLTNGNGFTNGLGASRYHREVAMARWKLYVIPLLSVVLLLLPLLGPGNQAGSVYPITIDGSAGDWQPAAIAGQSPRAGLNPNIDILRFGVADNVDYLAFFAEVNGTALRGGDSPPTLDTFRFFIDTDRDASTGYRAGGLGADRLVEVSGWQGSVNASTLYEWDTNRNPSDWRGWIKAAGVTAAVSGGRLEAQVDWLTLVSPKDSVFVILRSQGFDGSVDVADYALNSAGGSLAVVESPVVPAIVAGANVQLLSLNVSSFGSSVSLTGLTLTLTGSAPFSAVSTARLVDGNASMIDSRVPVARRVPFQFATRTITPGTPLTLFAIVDTMGSNAETLGGIVSGPADIAAAGAAVTVRRLPSARDVGYLSSAPGTPRIDGGFAEWTAPTVDPTGDVQGPADPDVDLTGFDAQVTGNGSFFFTRVSGRMMAGTWVPKGNDIAPITSASAPDQDRDGVPDLADLLPYDFNNDGTPDSQSGGDYDGDTILDYGQVGGTDYWLNTTIPATFPAPYANRNVSVYIGPSQEPFRSRDDILRIFIDLDNSTGSGYAIGGVGADRLVEVSGDNGLVQASGFFTFTGGFPGAWSWLRTSNVSFALGYDRLELSAPGNLTPSGSRLYLEIGGSLGSVDTTSRSTRGTRGDPTAPTGDTRTSFDSAPEPLPRANPWEVSAPGTRANTLLDGSSNGVSTQYNHQRKVVRAGDVAAQTACDATNSDGCWYAVFSDQLVEDASTTAASTETLTYGTKVAGTFPTDIASENAAYIQYREAAPYSAKEGALNVGTGVVGSTVVQSGFGFQPKVVIFWWSGRTESVDTTGGANIARGFGVAVSTSDRRAVYTQSQDGVSGNPVTDSGHHDAAAIGALTTSGTIDGLADLQSMDSGGFTLVIDDQFTINLRVHFLALGGSDLTNAVTGILTEPGATGNQDTTTLAFQPDAVIFFSAMIAANPPGTAVDSTMMIGAAAGSTPANAVWAGGANDGGGGNSQTISYSRAGESVALFDTGVTTTNARASLTTWLSNGFRLNWAERGGSRRVEYLALKGGLSLVGDLTTQVDTVTTIVESGFGFTPKVGLLFSSTNAQDASDTPASDDRWSAGAFTSASERGSQGTFDRSGRDPTQTATSVQHVEVYVRFTTTDTVDALMDIQSVDTNGFTSIMDNADTSARFVWYIAFGAYPKMEVRYDWTGVPSGSNYVLHVKGYRQDEDVLVQVLTSPSTWNTRITISATSNTLYTYSLTASEYNSGAPSIRFVDATASESTVSDLWVDAATIVTQNYWDRIVLMRSSDTSGSTWGSQILLASGRAADSALLLARDSAEPSIAMDSAGYLHVVWVSASASGDQSTLNLVRYTKTTVAYPTQSQIASAGNWASITNVDDASTGFMPTVSTDSGRYPHVAWSGSKTSGTVYSKNQAAGTWRATVSWASMYTGISVDVSPQNDYVSLSRYYEAGTNEIQYTVCKNLASSQCDASSEFTKWDGTAGYDTVASAVETASYPSLATTFESNGDLWVAYAKDVDGTTRGVYARALDYPSGGWQSATTIDSLSGTIFTKPSIGIDSANNVHAVYVATSGPQVYYNKRASGAWGTRLSVDTTSDNPTIMVRGPNDATYGVTPGGVYWKTSASSTYFFQIPEFEILIIPILMILLIGIARRRAVRRAVSIN